MIQRGGGSAIDVRSGFSSSCLLPLDLWAAFDVSDATTIFLLSDGAPRRGDKPMDVDPILAKVREDNRFRRVRIHTVGFLQAGSNLRKFMTRLAAQNQGHYKELR
jgi:hypothetical protein